MSQFETQTPMDDVASQLEAARAIERELTKHQEELRAFERQFNDLQHLRDELRHMSEDARRVVPRSASQELDQALHAVIVALNQSAVRGAGNGGELDPAIERLAQDVLVEALTNIARHSGATESNFSIKREERWLFVSVFDNGSGNADPARGTGLDAIRQRVAGCGGHFSISSPPGRGTLLTVALPCESDSTTTPTTT